MDLINRDDALTIVKYSKDPADGIKSLPTVDAVEVVRCIECEEFEPNEIVAPQTGTCWHCEMVKSFNSFCSDGKPKDGE